MNFKVRFGTTCEAPKTQNTETVLSYQNIYRNSKMLTYHHFLNGVLLQKSYQKTIKLLFIISL